MRLTGMNLNLISLGGLALASGMNVDASVVVMENIFRHLESNERPTTFTGKLNLILGAVKEVRLAVIASTVVSARVGESSLSTETSLGGAASACAPLRRSTGSPPSVSMVERPLTAGAMRAVLIAGDAHCVGNRRSARDAGDSGRL